VPGGRASAPDDHLERGVDDRYRGVGLARPPASQLQRRNYQAQRQLLQCTDTPQRPRTAAVLTTSGQFAADTLRLNLAHSGTSGYSLNFTMGQDRPPKLVAY